MKEVWTLWVQDLVISSLLIINFPSLKSPIFKLPSSFLKICRKLDLFYKQKLMSSQAQTNIVRFILLVQKCQGDFSRTIQESWYQLLWISLPVNRFSVLGERGLTIMRRQHTREKMYHNGGRAPLAFPSAQSFAWLTLLVNYFSFCTHPLKETDPWLFKSKLKQSRCNHNFFN